MALLLSDWYKSYCMATEAWSEQLAEGYCAAVPWPAVKLMTSWSS